QTPRRRLGTMQYDHTRKIKSNSPNLETPSTSGTRELENQSTREVEHQSTRDLEQEDYQSTRLRNNEDNYSVSREVSSNYEYGTRESGDGESVEREEEALSKSGRLNEVPLFHYVRLAHEESLKHGWEKTGKSSTWEFCRYLKARQEFANLDADDFL